MTTVQELGNWLVLDQEAQDLLFREARTANAFTEEPVSDEHIRAIYELIKWGPTSMNQQPLRVVLVRSSEAQERLLPLMSEGNRAKTASAPLVAILAADGDFHEHLPDVFPHKPQAKELFSDPSGRAASARFNATIQVGYFILGVRAAGLAAGPMVGFDNKGVDREFFPDGRNHSLTVVNIGKPASNAWLERLPRLSYDQVVTEV